MKSQRWWWIPTGGELCPRWLLVSLLACPSQLNLKKGQVVGSDLLLPCWPAVWGFLPLILRNTALLVPTICLSCNFVLAPTTLPLTSTSVCSSIAIFTSYFYLRSRSTFNCSSIDIQIFHPPLCLETIPVPSSVYSDQKIYPATQWKWRWLALHWALA